MASNIKRVWLVRHGMTEWTLQRRFCGQSDIPLAGRGRVQARWLGRQLRTREIAALYSSDLLRARETARIIAAQRIPELPLRVSTAWREMNFGAWEGLTYSQIAAHYKEQLGFFDDPVHNSPPDGEPTVRMLQRVRAELMAVMQDDCWSARGDVVVVSHAGALRILLCDLLGMPLARYWQLRIEPGSLSAIDVLPASEGATIQCILVSLNQQSESAASSF